MNYFKYSSKQLLGLLLASYLSSVSAQTTDIDTFYFTADTNTILPNATISNDNSIITFDVSNSSATQNNDLGTLIGAEIDGYHRTGDGCGDSLYSVDTTTIINGIAMRATDVFTSAGIKVLDANTAGIPAGVNIDAISRDPSNNCNLLLSVDITTLLDGTVFKPDDIIQWNNNDGFSLYQATGFNSNIDGLHLISTNRLLISLDTGKTLPDLNGFDEDIFEISTASGSEFQLVAFEPFTHDESWQQADLNAISAVLSDDDNDGITNNLDKDQCSTSAIHIASGTSYSGTGNTVISSTVSIDTNAAGTTQVIAPHVLSLKAPSVILRSGFHAQSGSQLNITTQPDSCI